MNNIRIAAWNIAEGIIEDQATCLAAIARTINSLRPDIIVLNEICKWNAITYNGVDQVEWLQSNCGYAFALSAEAATLAFKGGKYVAVLSQFPISNPQRIEHSHYLDGGGYATLRVEADINGRKTHIFSTRLTSHDPDENLRSGLQLRDIIAAIPRGEDVIIGGDFNIGAVHDADPSKVLNYAEFIGATGLHNVLGDDAKWNDRFEAEFANDHLFFRGPWAPASAATEKLTNLSDHPWVRAELSPVTIGHLVGTVNIPQPIRVGVAVNFAVDVRDRDTGAPVPNAAILVNGVRRGVSGQAFGIVFNATYTRAYRIDPRTHERVAYWIGPKYPVVTLAAEGYETATLQLTFTGAEPPPDPDL